MKVTKSVPIAVLVAVALSCCGCQVAAPIRVWTPPEFSSTVGKRVAVAPISGDPQVAAELHGQIIAGSPSDVGRATQLVDAGSLQSQSYVRLVSAVDEESSDLAMASVAKRQGFDFMLAGELMESRGALATANADSENRLAISWRLESLGHDPSVDGGPVIVTIDSMAAQYPDLALLDDTHAALLEAAKRRTYGLITPSVQREEVSLAVSYGLPGSRALRRGNDAALAGQWGRAREIWGEVVRKHPRLYAAAKNMAIAEVAAQDFSAAKAHARRAIRLLPLASSQRTLVWVELKQRAYHQSFGLTDPAEGWFVTSDQAGQ